MRRFVVAAGVLALLVWSAAGWRGPELTVPYALEPGTVGVGAVVPSPSEPRTFSVTGLCLTAGRTATITEVTLDEARGLRVTDFGTARLGPAGPDVPGVVPESPRELGYGRAPVTQRCDEPGTVVLAYAAQLSDPAPARGSARGVTVHYVLDGVPGALTVPIEMDVCVGPADGTVFCPHRAETDSDG